MIQSVSSSTFSAVPYLRIFNNNNSKRSLLPSYIHAAHRFFSQINIHVHSLQFLLHTYSPRTQTALSSLEHQALRVVFTRFYYSTTHNRQGKTSQSSWCLYLCSQCPCGCRPFSYLMYHAEDQLIISKLLNNCISKIVTIKTTPATDCF